MAEVERVALHQFLTFRLGKELYAFDVGNVREILDYTNITPIPNTPEWVRGVINLRGAVVPVLDLKQKFGLPVTERTVNTCIIILDIDLGDDIYIMGMLADSVQEVFELTASEVGPAPRFGENISTEYIRGIGSHGGEFFVILDVMKVFSAPDLRSAVDVAGVAERMSGAPRLAVG